MSQGSVQVCLKDVADSKEAQGFLADGCQPLKAAFASTTLLLRPAEARVPQGGQTILWYGTIICMPCSKHNSFHAI